MFSGLLARDIVEELTRLEQVRNRCGSGAEQVRDWCGTGVEQVRDWCGTGAGLVWNRCGTGVEQVRDWLGDYKDTWSCPLPDLSDLEQMILLL